MAGFRTLQKNTRFPPISSSHPIRVLELGVAINQINTSPDRSLSEYFLGILLRWNSSQIRFDEFFLADKISFQIIFLRDKVFPKIYSWDGFRAAGDGAAIAIIRVSTLKKNKKSNFRFQKSQHWIKNLKSDFSIHKSQLWDNSE